MDGLARRQAPAEPAPSAIPRRRTGRTIRSGASRTGSGCKAPNSPEYAETKRADAPVRPRHGVRGGGLPEHRRVLEAEARHLHDHGRHLHAGLRLLQRRHRHARRARSARAGQRRRSRRQARPGPRRHHLGRPRRPRRRRRRALRRSDHGASAPAAPGTTDRGADARLPAQGRRASRPWSRPGPTSSTTISRPCRGSIRRSGPARATSPRCACCDR